MVLGLKIGWDHYHYMMHQGPTSWSLLKLGPCLFSNSSGCGLVTKMVHVACEQHDLVFHNTNKNYFYFDVVFFTL
jgi:hypothetical protein